MNAPVVLFVYNRPWHTQQTLEALMKNEIADESILYIYCDGPKPNTSIEQLKNINKVRSIVKTKQWCKEVNIIERDKNIGLADNITSGVTEIINKYEKVIVLEDDIVTSSSFLKYMNDALNAFQNEEKIMHISAYFPSLKRKLPDFFFYNQTSCWGWGTWKRSWKYYNSDPNFLYNELQKSNRILEFNMNNAYPFLSHLEANINGNIKTWAVKWHASVFLKKGLCLHPHISYVNNIGLDNSGVHCDNTDKYDNKNLNKINFTKPKKLSENKKARKFMEEFYRNDERKTFFTRFKNKIEKIFNL